MEPSSSGSPNRRLSAITKIKYNGIIELAFAKNSSECCRYAAASVNESIWIMSIGWSER